MGPKTMIKRAVGMALQGKAPAIKVAQSIMVTPAPAPVQGPAPLAPGQALGHDDSVMIFRSALLQREVRGEELRMIFDELIMTHPEVGAKIIRSGSLGGVQWDESIKALWTFKITRVAEAPTMIL